MPNERLRQITAWRNARSLALLVGLLRKPSWTETPAEGRWRSFDYDDLMKRDKVNLDIFWLRYKSLEDSDDLPTPEILAQEIADDLQTALEQFTAIARHTK